MRKNPDRGHFKGKVGEDNAALLGAMIITKYQLAALSRANVTESERKDFICTWTNSKFCHRQFCHDFERSQEVPLT